MHQTIRIHPAAPAKPPWGQACNGCGVCCAAEPCPVGALVSQRRSGACAALLWNEKANRYGCGLISDPQRVLGLRGKVATRLISALATRLVAAGKGCDSDAESLP